MGVRNCLACKSVYPLRGTNDSSECRLVPQHGTFIKLFLCPRLPFLHSQSVPWFVVGDGGPPYLCQPSVGILDWGPNVSVPAQLPCLVHQPELFLPDPFLFLTHVWHGPHRRGRRWRGQRGRSVWELHRPSHSIVDNASGTELLSSVTANVVNGSHSLSLYGQPTRLTDRVKNRIDIPQEGLKDHRLYVAPN